MTDSERVQGDNRNWLRATGVEMNNTNILHQNMARAYEMVLPSVKKNSYLSFLSAGRSTEGRNIWAERTRKQWIPY